MKICTICIKISAFRESLNFRFQSWAFKFNSRLLEKT